MMKISTLLLLCVCFHSAQPVQWTNSLPNHSLVYACEGDDLRLPWNFSIWTAGGETVQFLQWHYTGVSTQEMAVLTNGNFLPLPAFSGRVRFIPPAGIVLQGVKVSDSGNYTVEVSGKDSLGAFVKDQQSVVVQIGDDLMTTDTHLNVWENPVAILDTTTNEWAIELHCGTFTHLGHPPFEVEWTTPTGLNLSSSGYSINNGFFYLRQYQPIRGGDYSCSIPEIYTYKACLPWGSLKGHATYHLDEVQSRLNMLDAHQMALQTENNGLKPLVAETSLLRSQIYTLTLQQDQLRLQNEALENNSLDLLDQIQQLQRESREHVSFHAMNLASGPVLYQPLVLPTVLNNEAAAYSAATGIFTAPLSGMYFLIGSTKSWSTTDDPQQLELVRNNQTMAATPSDPNQPLGSASVHAVLHMDQHQDAWLQITSQEVNFTSIASLDNAATTFSGFLINVDP